MKDLTNELKRKIQKGDLKMKPKAYFIVGSIFANIGIIIFGVLSTFLLNVVIHRVRVGRLFSSVRDLPIGFKSKMLFQMFPWEVFTLALISMVIGIYLIKKFDVSYKKSFTYLATLLATVIFITALSIDKLGVNEHFKQRQPLRRLYEGRDILGTRSFREMPQKHKKNFERNLHPKL